MEGVGRSGQLGSGPLARSGDGIVSLPMCDFFLAIKKIGLFEILKPYSSYRTPRNIHNLVANIREFGLE